jgi:hypothetical protein
VFVFFDNDQKNAAPFDALKLKQILRAAADVPSPAAAPEKSRISGDRKRNIRRRIFAPALDLANRLAVRYPTGKCTMVTPPDA